MSTNTSSDQTQICAIIGQRNMALQLTGPPARYNLISPYPEYTQSQLDMRRKAEILQYKQQSTQTNQFTKSQKWSQLVNGQFQNNTKSIIINNPTYDASGINIIGNNYVTRVYNLVNNCPKDLYLPTPSSSCDVPGPVINLQYDQNIPLYNYITNNYSLSVLNSPVNNEEWKYYTSNNIFYLNQSISTTSITNENTLVTLYIQNVNKQSYNYFINTPIGIYVSGDVSCNNDGSGNIAITGYTCNVYYNNNIAYTVSNTVNSSTLKSVYFTTNTRYNTSKLFNGSIYVGNLTIPNIELLTTAGYIYNIKLSFNLSVSLPTFAYNNYVVGIYSNVSGNNLNQHNHCNLNTSTNPPPFQNFSFSGI